MSHEDQMRSLRLMGEYVIPAVREIGEELELEGPFERSPWDNAPMADANASDALPVAASAGD